MNVQLNGNYPLRLILITGKDILQLVFIYSVLIA